MTDLKNYVFPSDYPPKKARQSTLSRVMTDAHLTGAAKAGSLTVQVSVAHSHKAWSYGTRIADTVFLPDGSGVLLVSSHRYSATTAKHQHHVRRYLSWPMHVVGDFTEGMPAKDMVDAIRWEAEELLHTAVRTRTAANTRRYIASSTSRYGDACMLAKVFGLPAPAPVKLEDKQLQKLKVKLVSLALKDGTLIPRGLIEGLES